MAKKIVISTVQQTCDVQVLNINAYLIAKVLEAKIKLQGALDNAEFTKQKRDEEGNWIDVLDDNGNVVKEYRCIDGNMLNKDIMPILAELAEAFLS